MTLSKTLLLLASFMTTRLVATSLLLNTSSLATSSLNETASTLIHSLNTNIGPYCVSTRSWTGPRTVDLRFLSDCTKAGSMLRDSDVKNHPYNEFEFLNTRTPPVHHNPLQRTPRRYTYPSDACTVAIVNINDVPARFLAGLPEQSFPRTDVSSYTSIFEAFEEVGEDCLKGQQLGWVAAGGGDAIAVLVFATQSLIDQAIPQGFHPIVFSNGTTETGGELDAKE